MNKQQTFDNDLIRIFIVNRVRLIFSEVIRENLVKSSNS